MMKKLENLGKLLNESQQKKVTGGTNYDCIPYGASCDYNYPQDSNCCYPATCLRINPQGGYYCSM